MKKRDTDRLAAIARRLQADFLEWAREVDRMQERTMAYWHELDGFSYPRAEIHGELPMSLPHAIYGELRDVHRQLDETSLYLRSTGTLSATAIRRAWKEHRVKEARADAYASVAALLASLNDPRTDPEAALRSVAGKLLGLARQFRDVRRPPEVGEGWQSYYEEVNRYLDERDFSQAALADKLGVTASQLSSTIRGLGKRTSAKQRAILREIAKLSGIQPPVDLPDETEKGGSSGNDRA